MHVDLVNKHCLEGMAVSLFFPLLALLLVRIYGEIYVFPVIASVFRVHLTFSQVTHVVKEFLVFSHIVHEKLKVSYSLRGRCKTCFYPAFDLFPLLVRKLIILAVYGGYLKKFISLVPDVFPLAKLKNKAVIYGRTAANRPREIYPHMRFKWCEAPSPI